LAYTAIPDRRIWPDTLSHVLPTCPQIFLLPKIPLDSPKLFTPTYGFALHHVPIRPKYHFSQKTVLCPEIPFCHPIYFLDTQLPSHNLPIPPPTFRCPLPHASMPLPHSSGPHPLSIISSRFHPLAPSSPTYCSQPLHCIVHSSLSVQGILLARVQRSSPGSWPLLGLNRPPSSHSLELLGLCGSDPRGSR
jgi:hypothetical protein